MVLEDLKSEKQPLKKKKNNNNKEIKKCFCQVTSGQARSTSVLGNIMKDITTMVLSLSEQYQNYYLRKLNAQTFYSCNSCK